MGGGGEDTGGGEVGEAGGFESEDVAGAVFDVLEWCGKGRRWVVEWWVSFYVGGEAEEEAEGEEEG